MSFGWSACDVAAAITFFFNLVEALDSRNRAAGNYREAVTFLQNLKRTLEPSQTFTAWNAYPTYGGDIKEQVEQIKRSGGTFLDAVLKYESGLGAKAVKGHHRHIIRKLQWSCFMSKEGLSLRKKIESYPRIIDSLMQRLTLDVVCTTQQKFPDNLCTTFQEVLRPELIAVFRENLPPLNPALLEQYLQIQSRNYDVLVSKLSEHYEGMASDIGPIKLQLKDPNSVRRRIEC